MLIAGCGGDGGDSATSTSSTSSSGGSSENIYAQALQGGELGHDRERQFPEQLRNDPDNDGPTELQAQRVLTWHPPCRARRWLPYTALTDTPMALNSYADVNRAVLEGFVRYDQRLCLESCATTAANLGANRYLISGTAMFNPYEMDASTPAAPTMPPTPSPTATGLSQTAYFLDHASPHSNGSTWHAHGNPDCVTSQVDTSEGPSHIIGIALDGFPIYGGRDINGNIIDVSQLDACNASPARPRSFRRGVSLRVADWVNTKNASMNCYSGTVSQAAMAAARSWPAT